METKKSNKANLENRKNDFFQIGLLISLLLVFAAFEWKTYQNEVIFPKHLTEIPFEELPDVLEPEKIKPEPPKPQPIELIITEEPIEQVEITIEEIEDYKYAEYAYVRPVMTEETPENQTDEPFIIVQKMPEFPGGVSAMNEFLKRNIKYPQLAKEIGITGTVFISFIVEKDGTLSSQTILKGIGGGCDEEALRVIRMMPKWEPGKQREVPVRVLFNLPVRFTLKNM
jgi:periplasmic protein TonB